MALISGKPSAATRPRLVARARSRRETVVPRGCAFQIAFNADCISPNTPEAVMSRVVAPTTEARMPLDLPDALCRAVCTRSALALPINSLSWLAIAPRAASSPKARPAMATTMNNTGRIEGRYERDRRSPAKRVVCDESLHAETQQPPDPTEHAGSVAINRMKRGRTAVSSRHLQSWCERRLGGPGCGINQESDRKVTNHPKTIRLFRSEYTSKMQPKSRLEPIGLRLCSSKREADASSFMCGAPHIKEEAPRDPFCIPVRLAQVH